MSGKWNISSGLMSLLSPERLDDRVCFGFAGSFATLGNFNPKGSYSEISFNDLMLFLFSFSTF